MSAFAALLILEASSSMLQTEVHLGVAASTELIPTSILARLGAGIRGSHVGAGVFFEKSLAHGGVPNESCRERGAEVGGCLYSPMNVGAEFSVTPVRWLHVEPFVYLTAAWVRREVFLRSTDRDDLALGGGLGVNLVWLPVTVGIQTRYLRYVTYHPQGTPNTNAFALGINVGYRFSLF